MLTWRKLALGTWVMLLMLLVPAAVVLADNTVNLDELVRNRLAETQKINTGCLKCHNQKPSTMGTLPGQAPFVDPDDLQKSVHSQIACTKCHADVKEGTKPSVSLGERDVRVAFSCVEEENIAELFELIYQGVKDLTAE